MDGLKAHGYQVVLANPAGNEQYSGLKYTDDKYDARWLAQMVRLGIIKTGYIYPKQERPIRDLLRKRMKLVGQRTANLLSVQNTISRNTGLSMRWRKIEELTNEEMGKLFGDELISQAPKASLPLIGEMDKQIKQIEKTVTGRAKLRDEYELLKTVWGVGTILGLTIMYETGEISRFEQVGDRRMPVILSWDAR